jgi:hypothetical protein
MDAAICDWKSRLPSPDDCRRRPDARPVPNVDRLRFLYHRIYGGHTDAMARPLVPAVASTAAVMIQARESNRTPRSRFNRDVIPQPVRRALCPAGPRRVPLFAFTDQPAVASPSFEL